MIFLSRPRSSLVADLSLRPRREEVAKEAGKLLPNYLVSEMPADKRGHCFRDPVRIPVSQRNDKMSQLRPGSHQTCLVSTRNEIRNLEIRALTPDIEPPDPLEEANYTEKRLATRPISLPDPRANSCSSSALQPRTWAKFRIVPLIVACLPACPQAGRGGRGRGRHTCAK